MGFDLILNAELAATYKARGLWTNRTFFEILQQRAARHPDREVFCDASRRISYGELKEGVERCAEFFRRIGIRKGDVVTVQLPNRIEFPIVFFSLELIGAIANKVNPDFRSRELEYILKFSGSRAFVCPKEFKNFDYVAMAKSLRKTVPGLDHLIVAGGAVEDTQILTED
jgi:non-ribosomal peptide synthetase component E (peptide arylation enzyme)